MGLATNKISVLQGVGMLVSALLGSGVFIIPAIAAQVSGSWSFLAWAVMGIFIIPIVFTFAQLGRFYPHAGGTAHFVQQAFGERSARLVSWLFIWVVALGAPVITMTAANFLQNTLIQWSVISIDVDFRLYIAIFMLLLVLTINFLELKIAAIIQSLLSVVIVSTLLFASIDTQLHHSFQLPTSSFDLNEVALTATFILWCFPGISIALVVYGLISISLLQMSFYGDQEKSLIKLLI